MDKEQKVVTVRRPDILKRLNAESLHLIERGFLGDIPDKLKPRPPVPTRATSKDLVVAKPTSFLSACLPLPDSPVYEKASDEENQSQLSSSPLKKSFSFRGFSRISFLRKNKEKPKRKPLDETGAHGDDDGSLEDSQESRHSTKSDFDHNKSHKRFFFFRQKEMENIEKNRKKHVYKRSKSFEFLPKAIEEDEDLYMNEKKSSSFLFSSRDTMGDAWTSNDSLEYITNVYYDNEDGVFLKSVKEISSESSKNNSSVSTISSVPSGLALTSSNNIKANESIFEGQSFENLLKEFDKAVDMFSENYLSDCEPYTQSEDSLQTKEKRKSSSFSTLPSPKVLQSSKVSEVSEDFKVELNRIVRQKRASAVPCLKSPRRGSVTDWFVLEDKAGGGVAGSPPMSEQNKYRRAQKRPVNRVRRISSTKYWITPEECAVYSREQRPPLVIPRITQYRPIHQSRLQPAYAEEPQDPPLVKSSPRNYERLNEWSPTSEKSRAEMDRSFSKANSDSPPFTRLNKRFGGSTENLLGNIRRPTHLNLPASSSGDSLDVEVREHKEPGYARSRKSRSMVAPKHRMRSPVPVPRTMMPTHAEAAVLSEGPVKRTKFSESGKKCRKNWTDCYMVLTPTALIFYKDERTYQASKVPRPPGTPPSPTAPRAELVLPLRNAHVMQCIQNHTRRYTRSIVLTVGYDQYLLQDDCEEGARRWMKNIQNVYYKLGPPRGDDYPLHSQSSNTDLESLGRTPPVSRHSNRSHKAGGSSNEDLSDSTEVSIPKVKRTLRNFFAKRPTMDSLVKKGIYQEEPVFGRKLDEVCPTASPRVPDFVVACVKEIESSEENMCTDGLYRASGNLSQVQKIRLEVDQSKMSVLETSADIHVLTGSLKLFFRELKEPLIPCSIFDRVLAACSIKPREAKIKEFRDIVNALPQCNRETLKFVLEHLLRVTKYSERNRMHTANLAIVFGPTLLWAPAEQAHNIAIDCIQQNHVVEILLNEFKEIFDDGKAKKKT